MGTGSSVISRSSFISVERRSSGTKTERRSSKPKIDDGKSRARLSLVDYNDTFDEDRPPCFSTFLSKSAIASSKSHMFRVMQDDEGKKAFENFLKIQSPKCSKVIDSIQRCDTVETNSSNSSKRSSTRSLFQDEINEFEIPVHSLEDGKEDCSKNYTEHEVLTKNMLDLKAWPLFLLSKEYAVWNKKMRKQLSDKREKSIAILNTERISHKEQSCFLERIDQEFKEILKNQPWVDNLLQSVEGLPICISIATANKDQHGFPLVYVNEYFLRTTGYSREEVLGQNCRFLQTGPLPGQHAEPNSIARLSSGLADGRCVKVAITNFKKDGTPFMNLLSLKPVFDSRGTYTFVVGLQFDIGETEGSQERLVMMQNLLSKIPDRVESRVESF